MKIVVAIDSMKGSLSSLEAGTAAADGLRRVFPEANVVTYPLADGGEGTVNALVHGAGGVLREICVTGPLGKEITANYGVLPKNHTAIIEIATAVGLPILAPQQRDPLVTTTYGVGQMIRDAITQGCRNFVIGLGGSATNDGGVGMLQALGFEFQNAKGQAIPFGAKGLEELVSITDANVLPGLSQCRFRVACDVNNPLCGDQGASAIYGPQKGATAEQIRQMDHWLSTYAELAQKYNPQADPNNPGAGAAGGLGFAFLAFLNATLEPGVQIVLEEMEIEAEIARADIVITGEGCLDGQTSMGKAPIGVARMAKKYGKPVIAFAGSVTEGASACNEGGIDAYFPILRRVTTLEEAMSPENARQNLTDTVEQVFRLIRLYPGSL